MNDNKRAPVQTIKCDKSAVGVTKGKILYLRKEGSAKQGGDFFKITNTVGEGGSCVCYEATLLGEKKNGRLKEFYPLGGTYGKGLFSLVRNEHNHVVSTAETQDAFKAACNDFVESYHLLRNVMAENRKNADFTSFIPDFSIYYACDENGEFVENSTVYIWTAPQNLMVFEKYIEEIHRYPGAHPEHKLFTVLKTILTLTHCIKILHEKGLLHLDIKPGNFGIPQRKSELLTDSVTLFDVNTIYSLKNAFTTGYGTEGFHAPEVARGRADNTSDIYSIGCTLFSSLIVSDEVDKLGYSREYYSMLSKLIESSKLISASETNSNLYLKHVLTHILKKCLAESPSRRYQSCEELAEDLKEALSYLYPSEIKTKLKPNQELVIMDKELDKKHGAGTHLSLIYHLYQKPLFEYADDGKTIDILVVGFGNYGQKFLDSCLQLGQVSGKMLNVNVISNNRISEAADKDIYLASRPQLSRFFNIDGESVSDAYGNISFKKESFDTGKGASEKNKKSALNIICEHEKTSYIFIALGDDWLNKNVAQAFTEALVELDINCSVNFVLENEQKIRGGYGNPVWMSRDITVEPDYRELERMAFNTHLAWEDCLNIDMTKAWQDFKTPYNYFSSFSYAVSVKYKLHSLHLPMDSLCDAARQYAGALAGNGGMRDGMIAAEHRRWNCEKICEGYTPNSDLESCIDGPTRDKKLKKHVCLVRSGADAPLKTAFWSHSKWDNATEKEISCLDELDRLSVNLHQTYKKHADDMRKNVSLFDDNMKQLKMICDKDASCQIAFSEWFSALSLLWSGDVASLKEYKPLKDKLVKSLTVFESDDRNTAAMIVEIIDKRFSLILKSLKYTDWKETDARLVDAIPFILTNKRNVHLAIPLAIGNNTQLFGNVAAPTVVNPSQVTYVHYFAHADDVAAFNAAVKYIFNYLPEKNVAAKVNFVLAYRINHATEQVLTNLKKELEASPLTHRVLLVEAEDTFDASQKITSVLDKKLHPDAIEQNLTPLSHLLLGAGVYRDHSKYCFDINNKRFYDVAGCDYLKYIRAGQYLKVSDMFATQNSKGVLDSPLSFYKDYQRLWKKAYRSNESLWKTVCAVLSNYHEKYDTVVSINRFSGSNNQEKEIEGHRYLVPAGSFAGASKVIDFMKDAGVFEAESAVSYYTPDSCEIKILAQKKFNSYIKVLFDDPEYIAHHEQLRFVTTPKEVVVQYDHLKVCNLDLQQQIDEVCQNRNGNRPSVTQVKDLLKMLAGEFAYIYGVKESENSNVISFHYATGKIKELLTNEGNILEVYIYIKCLKSGLFDDVVTGYEVAWDDTPIKNEFDIIITKGFKVLLIEAKAQIKILDTFYYKLSSLANQFGTNCKAVIVADTKENPYSGIAASNDIQRQRGENLKISTIFDPKEIDAIDKSLAKLLESDSIDADL